MLQKWDSYPELKYFCNLSSCYTSILLQFEWEHIPRYRSHLKSEIVFGLTMFNEKNRWYFLSLRVGYCVIFPTSLVCQSRSLKCHFRLSYYDYAGNNPIRVILIDQLLLYEEKLAPLSSLSRDMVASKRKAFLYMLFWMKDNVCVHYWSWHKLAKIHWHSPAHLQKAARCPFCSLAKRTQFLRHKQNNTKNT